MVLEEMGSWSKNMRKETEEMHICLEGFQEVSRREINR